MKRFFRVQSPARLISLGFAATILLGSALLMLPCSVRDGAELKYIDALYTSTSAVCVTGLIAVDAGDTFTSFGQVILALLIQIGGLGITSIGAGIMLAMGKKLDLKSRRLIQEASNLDSNRGAVRFIRSVLRTTLIFELAGAILSFFVFVQDYPPLRAMGISLFHSVAAFNNSGFDILGNFQNLIPYQNSVMLNLTTCGLVFFGGIGFLVIREMVQHKLKWRKYSMHAKVVLSVSGALILAGTLLLKATEDISWLGALFHSVSARTAGFSTYPLKTFSNAGLLEASGIQNCDVAVVCIGEQMDTSILTTLHLVALGIPKVIAKATSAEHGLILEKLGAEVVYPERDMAVRLASRLETTRELDIIQLSEQINISKIQLPEQFVGKSVADVNLRRRFGLNIIAIENDGRVLNDIRPDYVFQIEDTLFLAGSRDGLFKINQRAHQA